MSYGLLECMLVVTYSAATKTIQPIERQFNRFAIELLLCKMLIIQVIHCAPTGEAVSPNGCKT